MLVGISGTLCSGKESLCQWLVQKHDFVPIHVRSCNTSLLPADAHLPQNHADSPSNEGLLMSVEEIMAYMMIDRNWERNYVLSPLHSVHDLVILQKRPFFILLAIDAPLGLRFERYMRKYAPRLSLHTEPWAEFIRLSDSQPTQLNLAHQLLHNTFHSLDDFHRYLDMQKPSLANRIRCRPSWDDYFMLLADLASYRSNCMKRRVGCIVVRDCRVIATGYNGTPRGLDNCNDGGCARCNDGAANNTLLGECLCMHAEENALLEAGRERISGRHDERTVVYCNTFPCLGCAKKMIQVGVAEVVYRMEYGLDSRVASVLKRAGVMVRQHFPSARLHLENGTQDGREEMQVLQ